MQAFKVVDVDWNKSRTNARVFDLAGGFKYVPGEIQIYDANTMFSVVNGFYAFQTLADAQKRADQIRPEDGRTSIIEVTLFDPISALLNNEFQILVSQKIFLNISEITRLKQVSQV